MPEKPKPEQYKLDLEEPDEKPDEESPGEETSGTDNDKIEIIKNDDETCGEGHPKDRSEAPPTGVGGIFAKLTYLGRVLFGLCHPALGILYSLVSSFRSVLLLKHSILFL